MFTFDTAAGRLVPLGRFPVGAGEAYGMCLWTHPRYGALFGFIVLKDGRIDQMRIDASTPRPVVIPLRSMKLATQAEGCVVDDRTGLLYVAEKDVGLWRFAADPAAPATATPIARVDGARWLPMPRGSRSQGRAGGYLVVSSQGDSAYTLYRLLGATYAGRFRLSGRAVDGTSETDGIELALGNFRPAYTEGWRQRSRDAELQICELRRNPPRAEAKLIDAPSCHRVDR